MIKILITGGAGFIGSHLTEKLMQNKKYNVFVADNLLTGKKTNLKKNFRNFYKIDVNDYNQISNLFKKFNFDYVFHFAAVVGVKRTLEKPFLVLKDIEGFKNIFQLSFKYKVKRIFFSSSSEVYGEPVSIPQNEETTPLNSRLPYAIVKNVGESYCKIYFKEKKLNYTIFRFFNTYGKRQTNDYVLSKFINLAKQNNDITIYGKGFQSRTFCYIDDNIEAVIKSFEENKFVNEIVNIGNNKVITILKLAKIIKKITKSKSNITNVRPLEEGDMKRRKPDLNKMKKLIKRNLITIEEGIKKII